MIDKQSVRSLIEDCETQIQHCREGITNYFDDLEQRDSFFNKIHYYEFMIERLKRFL